MSDEMNFAKYKKMIEGFTNKTHSLLNGLVSYEDLYQIFCITYSESVKYFLPEYGSFSTYLYSNLNNRMKKIMIENNKGDLAKQGKQKTNQYLADNRYSPIPSVTCIFCHRKDNECELDREKEKEDWKTSCSFTPKESYKCEKWTEHRYDNYAEEVELDEEMIYEEEPPTEEISILMADCAKNLNEREMRIVRQIIDSPEGHFDFIDFCEKEGVSQTVIARALDGLKEKMKTILGRE